MLDRLMGRPVLAEPDRIMGEHMGDAQAHQRGEAQRGPAIIGEAKEARARGDEAAMQRQAVAGRRHAMFANAPMEIAAGHVIGRNVPGRGDPG